MASCSYGFCKRIIRMYFFFRLSYKISEKSTPIFLAVYHRNGFLLDSEQVARLDSNVIDEYPDGEYLKRHGVR